MELRISHQTDYQFDKPVFLEPHLIRVKPATNHRQRLLSFTVEIDPKPAGTTESTDQEGNQVIQAWFEEETQSLVIRMNSLVDMLEYDSFGFLIYPSDYLSLGFAYSSEILRSIAPYLGELPRSEAMKEFSQRIRADAQGSSLKFLSLLAEGIYQDFTQEFRASGPPNSPETTFDLKRGSCRDLVVMMLSMARENGFASRFTSGYLLPDPEEKAELHAWAEFYLPGAGWIGFDTTSGLAIDQHHVWVAASSNPQNTLPIAGNYRGDSPSKLTTKLSVTN